MTPTAGRVREFSTTHGSGWVGLGRIGSDRVRRVLHSHGSGRVTFNPFDSDQRGRGLIRPVNSPGLNTSTLIGTIYCCTYNTCCCVLCVENGRKTGRRGFTTTTTTTLPPPPAPPPSPRSGFAFSSARQSTPLPSSFGRRWVRALPRLVTSLPAARTILLLLLAVAAGVTKPRRKRVDKVPRPPRPPLPPPPPRPDASRLAPLRRGPFSPPASADAGCVWLGDCDVVCCLPSVSSCCSSTTRDTETQLFLGKRLTKY